jgi:Nucleotide-sugar transporter
MTEKDDREEADTQQDESALAVEEQLIPTASNDGMTKKRTKTVVVKTGKVIKKKLVKKVTSVSKESPRDKLIKYSALFLLIAQMVGLVLLMRFTRTHQNPGQPMYLATSAVFVMEIMKFMICCIVIAYQSRGKLLGELKFHIMDSPGEMLKLCVPSLLYTVQNNLLYLALSNLDAATYQVCYQLKILTTALFSALLLQVCHFVSISKTYFVFWFSN